MFLFFKISSFKIGEYNLSQFEGTAKSDFNFLITRSFFDSVIQNLVQALAKFSNIGAPQVYGVTF